MRAEDVSRGKGAEDGEERQEMEWRRCRSVWKMMKIKGRRKCDREKERWERNTGQGTKSRKDQRKKESGRQTMLNYQRAQ